MRNLRRRLLPLLAVVLLVCSAMTVTAFAAGDEAAAPSMYGTFWALIPPFVAIILALITKQSYLSMLLGVIVGGLFVCTFSTNTTLDTGLSDRRHRRSHLHDRPHLLLGCGHGCGHR